jgi:hypothetical protein
MDVTIMGIGGSGIRAAKRAGHQWVDQNVEAFRVLIDEQIWTDLTRDFHVFPDSRGHG